ncbi:hypothetical protein BDZ89DRAFT_1110242 [Hymenopellis radicata]|nr:hypothetical protein BDZ89DRAFT_1110242 [Hymenopellis radicata]
MHPLEGPIPIQLQGSLKAHALMAHFSQSSSHTLHTRSARKSHCASDSGTRSNSTMNHFDGENDPHRLGRWKCQREWKLAQGHGSLARRANLHILKEHLDSALHIVELRSAAQAPKDARWPPTSHSLCPIWSVPMLTAFESLRVEAEGEDDSLEDRTGSLELEFRAEKFAGEYSEDMMSAQRASWVTKDDRVAQIHISEWSACRILGRDSVLSANAMAGGCCGKQFGPMIASAGMLANRLSRLRWLDRVASEIELDSNYDELPAIYYKKQAYQLAVYQQGGKNLRLKLHARPLPAGMLANRLSRLRWLDRVASEIELDSNYDELPAIYYKKQAYQLAVYQQGGKNLRLKLHARPLPAGMLANRLSRLRWLDRVASEIELDSNYDELPAIYYKKQAYQLAVYQQGGKNLRLKLHARPLPAGMLANRLSRLRWLDRVASEIELDSNYDELPAIYYKKQAYQLAVYQQGGKNLRLKLHARPLPAGMLANRLSRLRWLDRVASEIELDSNYDELPAIYYKKQAYQLAVYQQGGKNLRLKLHARPLPAGMLANRLSRLRWLDRVASEIELDSNYDELPAIYYKKQAYQLAVYQQGGKNLRLKLHARPLP